jgi:hypothetical protein
VRRDLNWWKTLLPLWHGVAAIAPVRSEITIATDASGKKGIGGIWFATGNMFSTRMPKRHRSKHIHYKEMHTVLYAFAEWSEKWSGQSVNTEYDNDAVVVAINKRIIRGAAIQPLQSLLLITAIQDITVRVTWISRKANTIADALSRFNKKYLANLLGAQLASTLRSRKPSQISQKISRLKRNITSTTLRTYPPTIISTIS